MFDINKLSSDLILFSMPELGIFEIPEEFCTGSSIMPQKKNPDVLELLSAGMGIQFLKHIERTRLFLHLIDITDPAHEDPIKAYEALRGELGAYHESLLEKPEIIVLTKMDVTETMQKKKEVENYFKKREKLVYSISAVKQEGLKDLLGIVSKILQNSREATPDPS